MFANIFLPYSAPEERVYDDVSKSATTEIAGFYFVNDAFTFNQEVSLTSRKTYVEKCCLHIWGGTKILTERKPSLDSVTLRYLEACALKSKELLTFETEHLKIYENRI